MASNTSGSVRPANVMLIFTVWQLVSYWEPDPVGGQVDVAAAMFAFSMPEVTLVVVVPVDIWSGSFRNSSTGSVRLGSVVSA